MTIDLTELEKATLDQLMTGKSQSDMGKALFITPQAVALRLTKIYKKTGGIKGTKLIIAVASGLIKVRLIKLGPLRCADCGSLDLTRTYV